MQANISLYTNNSQALMTKYNLKFFVLTVLLSLCLAACGGGHQYARPATNPSGPDNADMMNKALAVSSISAQEGLSSDYLIGPEDLLEIEAYNVDELKKTVRVNSQGDIGLPLVGVLNVKGLTTSEVEKKIAGKLDRYVEETLVTVFVKEYKSQRISVIGAVNKSQVFAVTGQRYLLDMLMMAEGLSKEAGSVCYIIRPALKNNSAQNSETMVVHLDELLINGNLSLNIPVFAGDVINIPKGGVFFVDGSVRTPGAYNMKGRMTLTQAISMAQGVNNDANYSDVRIFRENGRGEREVIVADYDAIKNGKQSDVPIEENDIIIVPRSGVKNFFNGFVSTIKGLVTFGTVAL
jgi:polysaccharide biosynthesis/export protein